MVMSWSCAVFRCPPSSPPLFPPPSPPPPLHHRPNSTKVVEPRLAEIEKAYLEKDFATFGKITMQDSNQFHATCLDTFPPIFYMNDVSR